MHSRRVVAPLASDMLPRATVDVRVSREALDERPPISEAPRPYLLILAFRDSMEMVESGQVLPRSKTCCHTIQVVAWEYQDFCL